MAYYAPVVYDAVSFTHQPISSGQLLDPSHIPVSPAQDNLILVQNDGLAVTISGLISSDPDNVIQLIDGKLLVKSEAMENIVSKQAGNLVRYGNDSGVFIDGNDILSNGAENVLRIDAVDGRVVLTAQDIADAVNFAATIVSADANNVLRAGSDGGAFLASSALEPPVSTQTGNMLTRDSSGALLVPASVVSSEVLGSALSPQAGNILTTDASGKLLVTASDIASGAVSTQADNLIGTDASGKLYVSPAAAVSDITSPSSANLLTADGNGKMLLTANGLVSVDTNNALVPGTDGKLYVQQVKANTLVDANDKILVVSSSGTVVSTVLTATYDIGTGILTLKGKNDMVVTTVNIPSTGSTLISATIVVDPAGQPAGTYLAMTFRLADSSTTTVYANLSTLSVYTAGNGIDISGQVISVKLATNSGLVATANGLAVSPSAAAAALVSTDTNNAVQVGTDNLLYVPLDCGEI